MERLGTGFQLLDLREKCVVGAALQVSGVRGLRPGVARDKTVQPGLNGDHGGVGSQVGASGE